MPDKKLSGGAMHEFRSNTVASMVTVLTLAGLLFGAGRADAGFPCSDNLGTTDLWFDNSGITYVGVEAGLHQPPTGHQHGYVCVAPFGGEPNQSWFRWDVNPTSTGTGYVAQVTFCSSTLSPTCPDRLLGATGAQVGPAATPDLPGGGTTGGSLGTGVCTYVNGAPRTCAPSVSVTVREADLPQAQPTATSPPPPCTGINNTCPGAQVIVGGDRTNPTVSGTVTGDIPYNCVQVNSTCPP